MTWFSELTGIEIETPQSVHQSLRIEGSELVSLVNSARFGIGILTMPSLNSLRSLNLPHHGAVTVQEVVADVQDLHALSANAGAAFQVASQFNLLEMIGPSYTPEDGVGRYEDDRTQGPACAIACGAGTIYRNYFAPVGGGIGQSIGRQIDVLEDLGNALENENKSYWRMKNGYALPSNGGLSRLNIILDKLSPAEVDRLRGLLRIGVHLDTEVTHQNAGHRVTQLYCSAMPVAYSADCSDSWQHLAKLVLEAAYEATLRAAWQNSTKTANNKVFLTLLGGGAFGNRTDWIIDAILRAIRMVSQSGLEIYLVSYGGSNAAATAVVDGYVRDRA